MNTARTHSAAAIRPPVSDEDLAALQQRNADRVQRAIHALGERWLLARSIGRSVDMSLTRTSR